MVKTYIDEFGEVRAGVFLRTEFNYDMDEVSEVSGLRCEDDSLAVQSSKDECDINTIVRNFGLTGQLPDNVKVPISGDFVDVTDYQSSLNAVIAADRAFMELPSSIRKRFDHDPQKLMDFVADAGNREAAIELGLIPKPVPSAGPVKVEVVTPPAAGNSST